MRVKMLSNRLIKSLVFSLVFVSMTSGFAQTLANKKTLVDSGDPSNRFDVVFVPDGFTEEKIDVYHNLVKMAINEMRSTEPYRSYFQYFNVHRLDVYSKEYGVSKVQDGKTTTVNTAFKTLHQPDENVYLKGNYDKVLQFAAAHAPDVDVVICIFPEVDGGVANGKTCFVGSASFWRKTAIHEMGHALGGVADEYVGTLEPSSSFKAKLAEFIERKIIPGPFEGANNVTTTTKRKEIPWKPWIKSSTPIPTPDSNTEVGLYKGARYDPDNYYRSQPTCIMRNSATADQFCVACGEQIQLRICQKVMPLTYHKRDNSDTATFSVRSMIPGPTAVRWFVNGKEIAKAKLELTLKAQENEKTTTHTVQVEVLDASAFVRSDPESILLYGHTWTVEMGNNRLRVKKEKSIELVTGFMGWFRDAQANFHGNWPRIRNAKERFESEIAPSTRATKTSIGLAGSVKRVFSPR